jgi:hypothetical protein
MFHGSPEKLDLPYVLLLVLKMQCSSILKKKFYERPEELHLTGAGMPESITSLHETITANFSFQLQCFRRS